MSKVLSIFALVALTFVSALSGAADERSLKTKIADTQVTLTEAQLSRDTLISTATFTSTAMVSMSAAAFAELAAAGTFMAVSAPVIAVGAIGASGFFLGKALIHADKLYLDGAVLDTFGRIMEPAFKIVYKIPSHSAGPSLIAEIPVYP